MRPEIELALPVDQRSVRTAREAVATIDGLAPERLADIQLVISELVTNAILHAGLAPTDRILFKVSRHGSRLRIDVDDAGTFAAESDTFRYPHPNNRGRGLRIVQTLAVHWQAADGCVTAWLDPDT